MKTVSPAFDFEGIKLPVTALRPIRQIKPADGAFGKYRSILASIREVGVIEPLIVFPEAGVASSYFVLDGHLRLKALQELQRPEVLCLIARDNDVLTYHDKVNRLSVIQEHAMIRRAIVPHWPAKLPTRGVTSSNISAEFRRANQSSFLGRPTGRANPHSDAVLARHVRYLGTSKIPT